MPDDPDREILLEMNRIGTAMVVRAISGSDGLEISFSAPANSAEGDIERLARSKLAYVRRKQTNGGENPESGPDSGSASRSGRGGIIA